MSGAKVLSPDPKARTPFLSQGRATTVRSPMSPSILVTATMLFACIMVVRASILASPMSNDDDSRTVARVILVFFLNMHVIIL